MKRIWKAVAAGLCLSLALTAPANAAAATGVRPVTGQHLLDDPTDLKQECEAHDDLASRTRGWAPDRYQQCHHYHRHITLYRDTGEELGYVEFDLWILAFAYSNSRRVDYVTSVENVKQTTSMADDLTYLTVTYSGCGNRDDVSCTGAQVREDTIAAWYAKPGMDVITVTSPDTAGSGPYLITNFLAQVAYFVEYRDGRTVPYQENAAVNAVRFDSAGTALGNGPLKGTVFVDNVPREALPLAGGGIDAEARHVDDALHHPERTFPSFVGKNPPSTLHRLMDKTAIDANHTASVGICSDVWGPDYASGGLDCDEYPYKSTYEGSAVSTAAAGEPVNRWQGSARPINAGQNQQAGTNLAVFYGANRILDGDAYTVVTVP